MIEKPQTQSRRIIKLLWACAVFAFVISGTFVLVSLGSGYRYDPDTGQVIQNGLLILDSQPNGASLSLNGNETSLQTADQVSLAPGKHNIMLSKAGFRTWNKTISLNSSQVLVLSYPFLFPTVMPTSPLVAFGANTKVYPAPDNARFIVSGVGSFRIFSSDNPQTNNSTITLPAVAADIPITSVEWSRNSRVAIVRAGLQYYYYTVQDNSLLDVSPQLVSASSFQWFADSDRELLVSTPTGATFTLQRIDMRGANPPVLVSDALLRYESADNGIISIARSSQQESMAELSYSSNGVTAVVASLPQLSDFGKLYGGRYQSDDYVAYVAEGKTKLQIFVADLSQSLKQSLPVDAKDIFVSYDGRFLVAQDGNKFASYDFEERSVSSFTLEYENISNIRGMRYGRFLAVADSKLISFEYDGENVEVLTDADMLPVFSSPDAVNVYSFITPAGSTTFNLQSTKISAQ